MFSFPDFVVIHGFAVLAASSGRSSQAIGWKQSFVLSAVFIAGRRRGFGRKVKSHIKNRGFIALKGYDVLSFGFPVTCLSKKKRKTTKHDKVKAKSNHDGSYLHFHVPILSLFVWGCEISARHGSSVKSSSLAFQQQG